MLVCNFIHIQFWRLMLFCLPYKNALEDTCPRRKLFRSIGVYNVSNFSSGKFPLKLSYYLLLHWLLIKYSQLFIWLKIMKINYENKLSQANRFNLFLFSDTRVSHLVWQVITSQIPCLPNLTLQTLPEAEDEMQIGHTVLIMKANCLF